MIVLLERGLCSHAELQVFLVTEAKRKHVRRCARFQQHQDTSCRQVIFLQGKAPYEIHAILTETGENAPSYATIKMWVAQFKRGDFSTCNVPRPGRPKTVTTPEIIDQIHELILEDRRISAKSIAEQLASHMSVLGPSFMKIRTHRALSIVGPEIPEGGSKTSMVPV